MDVKSRTREERLHAVCQYLYCTDRYKSGDIEIDHVFSDINALEGVKIYSIDYKTEQRQNVVYCPEITVVAQLINLKCCVKYDSKNDEAFILIN